MYCCFESLTLDPWPLTLDRLYPVKGNKRRERVYEGKCPISKVCVFQANGDKTKASVKRESWARPKRSESEIWRLGKRQWSLVLRLSLSIIIWILMYKRGEIRNTRYRNPQLVAQHEQICCVKTCQFDEKRATKPEFVAQSRPALNFSQQISSTCNKCFCCATSWSCLVKNGKHRPKLATKQCCVTSWGFLYLVFRRLNLSQQVQVM